METVGKVALHLLSSNQEDSNIFPPEEKSRIVKICLIKQRCFTSLLLSVVLLISLSYLCAREADVDLNEEWSNIDISDIIDDDDDDGEDNRADSNRVVHDEEVEDIDRVSESSSTSTSDSKFTALSTTVVDENNNADMK